MTSFILSAAGASLLASHFLGGTAFARVISVLVGGSRGGSSKLSGDIVEVEPVPLPAAGLLLLGGLSAFGLMRKRTSW